MQRRPEYNLNRLHLPAKVEAVDEKLGGLINQEELSKLDSGNVSEKWESCVRKVHEVADQEIPARSERNPVLQQIRDAYPPSIQTFRKVRVIDQNSRYNHLSDHRQEDPGIISKQRDRRRQLHGDLRKEQHAALNASLRKIETTASYGAKMNLSFKLFRHCKRASSAKTQPAISQQTFHRELSSLDRGVIPQLPEDDCCPLLPPPTRADVEFIISSQRTGTAPGTDSLYTEFLRVPAFVTLLLQFIIFAYINNELPRKWIETVMVLLQKKTKPAVFADFRPITLCSLAYKIYVQWLGTLLRPFMPEISDYQTGFLRNRSTDDTIIYINSVLTAKWNHNEPVYLLSIDLRRAFPSVNLHRAAKVLEELGAPTKLVNRIITACFHEYTSISYNGRVTGSYLKTVGVKQGCPLSPYIFVLVFDYMLRKFQKELQEMTPPIQLFMGEKDKEISFPLVTSYADDLNFLSTSVADLQRMYPVFTRVLKEFGFSINVEKSVLLLRSADEQLHQTLGTHCQLGNNQIPVQQQVIILGTRINSNMNRRNQIIDRCKRALPVYFSMLRNFKDQKLSFPLLVRLYRAILVPIMTYGLRSNSTTKGNRKLVMRRELMMLRELSKIAHPPPSNKQTIFNALRGRTINRSLSAGTLSYFSHVSRSQQSSLIRKAFLYQLTTRRKRGRPCYTFADVINKEINAVPFATDQSMIDAFKSSSETKKLCQIIYETPHNDLDPMLTAVTIAIEPARPIETAK